MPIRNCHLLAGCLIALIAVAPALAAVPDPAPPAAAAGKPTPEEAKRLAAMKQQVEAALREIQAGHLDEAVRLAKAAIATAGPDKAAVVGYEVLANALYQKHDNDGSIAALKQGLKVDPSRGAIYASLAGIAMNAGHRDEAKKYLEQAIKVSPDLPGAHERLGMLLQQDNDIADAIHEYELGLLNTPPDYVGSKVALADLYNRTHRAADAVRLLEPIVKPGTQNVAQLMVLGNAYVGIGQPQKALPLMSSALQFDHNDSRIGLALGAAQRQAGLNNASLDRLQQVVKAEPGSALANYELGMTYIALARYPEARQSLDNAAKLDPKALEISQMLGEVMLLQGKPDEAAAHFQTLIKRPDAELSAYVSLATALMALKRPDDAEAALREAVVRFPAEPTAYGRLGNLLAEQGKYEEALNMLRQGNQLAPEDPRLLNDVALVQARLGHVDDALAAARHLVRLEPKANASRFLLGSMLEAKGDTAGAIEIYRAILADNPDDPQALNNLASCLTDAGNAKDAIPLARHAVEAMPDNADITDTLGFALLKAGETAEAMLQLRTANRLRGSDPTLMYHLALAQQQTGDPQAARATLTTALNLPGQFREAPAARALLAEVSKHD